MSFAGWGDERESTALTPDGENEDSWTDPATCHMPANANWTSDTWFFEKGCANCVPVNKSDDPLDFSSRDDTPGVMAPQAANILMKFFYGAWFARWDMLEVITKLVTMITKWTTPCDSALLRLARYVHGTVDGVLIGYVGDSPAELRIRLFPDADVAGDRPSYKATSGGFLYLHGHTTYTPIAARSKKQTSASHSTPKAEIISLDF